MNNDNYSNLTKTIIMLSRPMEHPNRLYCGEEYKQYKDWLDEYLKYNTQGFENGVVSCQMLNTKFKDIQIPVYFVESTDSDNEYVLWINGDMSEINYTLKNKLNVKDAIKNNQGVISFSARIGYSMVFKKKTVNERFLCNEEYLPGKLIRTYATPINYVTDYVDDEYFEKHIYSPQSTFKSSPFWSHHCILDDIVVRKLENDTYYISVLDCDGREYNKEIIANGKSLYDVYYAFMVRRGYFKKPNQEGKTFVKK